MNLGHCLGNRHSVSGRAARDAIDIAYGRLVLRPRDPSEPEAVSSAESILGASPRPVYCFVGCLHPKLGTVGMIFDEASCSDGLQGISRCDSGGLAGGMGPFEFVPANERQTALVALSFRDGQLNRWNGEFETELTSSYSDPVEYAQGAEPDTSGWGDVRAQCLEEVARAIAAGALDVTDRRVWTWEARFERGPHHRQLRVLVLSSSEASSLTIDELRELAGLPNDVRVITGRPSPGGIEPVFASDEVAAALVAT